jgi:hypothetical protein
MNLPINSTEAELIIPELIMLFGLVAIILIPNLGKASFRIPLTRIHVPVFIGGSRFKSTNNPKLPNQISLIIFISALPKLGIRIIATKPNNMINSGIISSASV